MDSEQVKSLRDRINAAWQLNDRKLADELQAELHEHFVKDSEDFFKVGRAETVDNNQLFSVNIENIKIGDSVLHNGKIMTVCNGDIKRNTFCGTTLFGDSYACGNKQVTIVKYPSFA